MYTSSTPFIVHTVLSHEMVIVHRNEYITYKYEGIHWLPQPGPLHGPVENSKIRYSCNAWFVIYYKVRRDSLNDVKWTEVFMTLEAPKPVGLAVAHFRIPEDEIVRVLTPTLATTNITLAVLVTWQHSNLTGLRTVICNYRHPIKIFV